MALEVRAIWEFSALLPAWPLLNRAPRGDNNPVLVFPGLTANDISTAPLRRYLQLLNHAACGWDQGFNVGLGFNPSAWWAVADRLAQPEGEWHPFLRQHRGRLHGLIYPDPSRPA
jgi:hypothetical protein